MRLGYIIAFPNGADIVRWNDNNSGTTGRFHADGPLYFCDLYNSTENDQHDPLITYSYSWPLTTEVDKAKVIDSEEHAEALALCEPGSKVFKVWDLGNKLEIEEDSDIELESYSVLKWERNDNDEDFQLKLDNMPWAKYLEQLRLDLLDLNPSIKCKIFRLHENSYGITFDDPIANKQYMLLMSATYPLDDGDAILYEYNLLNPKSKSPFNTEEHLVAHNTIPKMIRFMKEWIVSSLTKKQDIELETFTEGFAHIPSKDETRFIKESIYPSSETINRVQLDNGMLYMGLEGGRTARVAVSEQQVQELYKRR